MPGSVARDVVTSQTVTASGQGNTIPIARGSSTPSKITLGLNISAASGTTPTFDLAVQWSFDGGTTWLTGPTADSFPQFTANGSRAMSLDPKGDAYRLKWTVAGTTPSFTFSVREVLL